MSKTYEISIEEIMQLVSLFKDKQPGQSTPAPVPDHPMLGRECVVRTYSAGVHIGLVDWVNPNNSMECRLTNALRLWKWEGGGLSLSAVANNGIKGGRLNRTGEVFLTNVIEYIPHTAAARLSYERFIE